MININIQIEPYLVEITKDVPTSVYFWLCIVFSIGTVFSLSLGGAKKGIRLSLGLLLAEYITLLVLTMVCFRPSLPNYTCFLTPFWSYFAIFQGKHELIRENLMNILVFIPIGFLAVYVIKRIKWWGVFLLGCGISISIELLQFIFERGFCEIDDVIHNTLGCMFGFGIIKFIMACYRRHLPVVNC